MKIAYVGLCLVLCLVAVSIAEATQVTTHFSSVSVDAPQAAKVTTRTTVRHRQRKHHHRSKTSVQVASGGSTGQTVSVTHTVSGPVKTSGCN